MIDLNSIRIKVLNLIIYAWVMVSSYYVYYYAVVCPNTLLLTLDTINAITGITLYIIGFKLPNIKILSMWALSPLLCSYTLMVCLEGDASGSLYGFGLATCAFFLFGLKKGFIAYSVYFVILTGYFLGIFENWFSLSPNNFTIAFRIQYTVLYFILGTYSYLAEKSLKKILDQIKGI